MLNTCDTDSIKRLMKNDRADPHVLIPHGGAGKKRPLRKPKPDHDKDVGNMHQYKLIRWPELPPDSPQLNHQQLLTVLSQGYVSVPELHHLTGLPVEEIRAVLKFLAAEDLLEGRDPPPKLSVWRTPVTLRGLQKWVEPLLHR